MGASIALLSVVGCGGNQAAGSLPAAGARAPGFGLDRSAAQSPIRHVVIIIQENRTPDNLFQGLRGADISDRGKNSHGKIVRLHAVPLEAPYDINHAYDTFVKEWDNGKIDGFNRDHGGDRCPDHQTCAYGYVPKSETKPYLEMASQYAFADRMFQGNQGPSFPAHQYLISGTSTTHQDAKLRASGNPYRGEGRNGGGCDAPPNTRVETIDLKGKPGDPAYPCFERPTLGDLLDSKMASWRYYQMELGPGLWHPYDAIRHIRFGPDYKNVAIPSASILSDIKSGTLANVSWVSPDPVNSDHPNSRSNSGPAWVASIVNAMGKSKYWKDCAIFVVWDDWGGWYDHVAPPIYNSYELGFRVPFIAALPLCQTPLRVAHPV